MFHLCLYIYVCISTSIHVHLSLYWEKGNESHKQAACCSSGRGLGQGHGQGHVMPTGTCRPAGGNRSGGVPVGGALTSNDLVAVIDEGTGQSFAVRKNLSLVGFELRRHGLFERHGNTWRHTADENVRRTKRWERDGVVYPQWRGCEGPPAALETQPG